MLRTVPIALDQILQETRHWPPERVGQLVGRLTEDLHAKRRPAYWAKRL